MVLEKFRLDGKLAIVTGGEGFLGKLICQTLNELGADTWSVDIKSTADIELDITNSIITKSVFEAYGFNCDILVNGAVGNQKAVQVPIRGWNEDIAIGLTGTVNMIETLGPTLKQRKGVVLNIGSDLGLIAPDMSLYLPGFEKPASYSVVKHGMIGLTRYYASLWGGEVRVNCLCPGGINQGQKVPHVPMKRLAELEELAGPIAFMVSDASSYMTGAVVAYDGGRTCW